MAPPSCGLFAYRLTPFGRLEFLLVRNKFGQRRWGWPKGEVKDRQERFITTAIREFCEETGLSVSKIAAIDYSTPFKTKVRYRRQCKRGETKTFVFFIAYVPYALSHGVRYQETELCDAKWMEERTVELTLRRHLTYKLFSQAVERIKNVVFPLRRTTRQESDELQRCTPGNSEATATQPNLRIANSQ